jgi:anti-sigma regulatory factor (Ser/Thr protein kinase)
MFLLDAPRAGLLLAALLCTPSIAAPSAATNEGRPVLRSIGALADPLQLTDSGAVAVRGVITLVRKRVIYVQDQTGAMTAVPQNGEQARLAIGDEVELQGRYERRDSTPVMNVTSIRKLWSGSPPVPLSLKPEQAAEGSFRGRLIDTEGRLLQKRVSGGYLRLTLEGDGQIFGATLELSSPLSGDSQLVRNLEEQSTIRLVGVCAPRAASEEAVGNAFLVLLRSTDDMRITGAPPWWNVRHAIWVACGVICAMLFFYRVHHRSLNLRFQAIVDERSRIAREMHDTLAQGFSGLTYQLEGLARELNASVDKDSIERHLAMALQLVRHCREEAHRSIFALRSLAQHNPDLLDLLLSSCGPLRARSDVRIATSREGKALPLPDDMLNHMLRIGQEAITNSLQHAHATEIHIVTRFREESITLEIRDNGRGFDVENVASVDAGRFGITGMKERAKHIHAELEISSEPGKGTTLTVQAPLSGRPQPGTTFTRQRPAQVRSAAQGSVGD